MAKAFGARDSAMAAASWIRPIASASLQAGARAGQGNLHKGRSSPVPGTPKFSPLATARPCACPRPSAWRRASCLIGCLIGNSFINAVCIGHPGWKAIGGRSGRSATTGAMVPVRVLVLVLSWFGILALLTALIPVVAISPILLYIGVLIGAQALQETPKRHAPAVIIARVPQVAAWGKLQIDNSLGAAGNNAMAAGLDKLGQVGVVSHGLEVPGSGVILVSLTLAAITAFMIDPEFSRPRASRWPARCRPASASCIPRPSAWAKRRWGTGFGGSTTASAGGASG